MCSNMFRFNCCLSTFHFTYRVKSLDSGNIILQSFLTLYGCFFNILTHKNRLLLTLVNVLMLNLHLWLLMVSTYNILNIWVFTFYLVNILVVVLRMCKWNSTKPSIAFTIDRKVIIQNLYYCSFLNLIAYLLLCA